MTQSKIKNFFNSFRNKVIIIIALVIIASALLFTKFFLKNDPSTDNNTLNTEQVSDPKNPVKPKLDEVEKTIDSGIDSVLSGFGIKKEWITTSYSAQKQKAPSKNPAKDVEWFSKTVTIPKDLSSIEVNADLNGFISSTGLFSSVSEDIITKDITLSVSNSDSNKSKIPLVKISVNHSDKIARETAAFCVILNNIGEYKQEDIDKLLLNKSEFSFVFPKNLDEINIQNKLLHHKKDVLISLTVGGKDNYDTDLNSGLDEKGVREKVKSFASDFPTISTVLLTKTDAEVSPYIMNLITGEFNKFNIKVINDSALVKLVTKAEEDSKEKLTVFFQNLKTKAGLMGSIVTLISVNADEFEKFYDSVLLLKKLGYKFYNYSEYAVKKSDMEKELKAKELKIKEDKLKQEQEEKKKQEKKKQPEKKPEKKQTDKKKTDTKKPTDKKQTTKPKTNDKKKK